MNRSSWQDVAGVDGVPEKLWEDGERTFYRIWRRGKDGTRHQCLAVLPAAQHPTPGSLTRLEHEHGLKDHVDGAWALRPLELVRDRGATVLVLEYHDGEPLDRLVARPLEVGSFLRISVALAAAIVRLHERGFVHKDVKPANILVDPAGDRVWLMGFGVASRLPREHQSPQPPELIAGTLAYMAPEQTGWMNRSIDSRSDLYALGVTLYQVLTGSLPFTATDPVEWVHSHIARRPVPPSARVPEVPSQLSAIIMKLLAKTPEERYHTAAGVERDLRRCLADWEIRHVIDEFPVAEQDRPDRLLISERLYGREGEIEILLAAFDRIVKGGSAELVLVSGPPGVGKSTLVSELHKALVLPRGLFASGKIDQLERDIPYAMLARAFQSLIRRLLTKPEAELCAWRDDIRQALDPNGALVVQLIPELKFIIGEQPAIPESSPPDAKVRCHGALRRLISVFARPEHPLALFLDDLQWLDAATLDLLEDLLVQRDLKYLLLVGAYSDREIHALHPLMRKLAGAREKGAPVQEIVLAPLIQKDLAHLIADALHCERHVVMPLAELVHQKTGGNPFFANHFIRELVEEGTITFDSGRASWLWDLGSMQAKAYTDNVADLMVGKLSRLPPITQEALKDLACLGNRAETSTLSIARRMSEEDVHSDLWEARRSELIVRSQDSYRFVHDRIREAAYSLIPEEERAQAHLRIGRLLAERIEPDKREDALFEIAGHLNRGSALMTSIREREELAALNLMAGKRAMTAGAYAPALSYLIAAAALLPEDGWERRHDLLFQLELHRAACEFMTGRVTPAQERLVALSHRATNAVERASVACLLADVHFTRQRPDLGLTACLECLGHAGLAFPKSPTEGQARAAYENVLSKIEGRSIDELVNLPMMTDRVARATMDVLAKVIPCAVSTDKNLLSLIVCAAIDLSLTHGNCDASCFAYQYFGFVAGGLFGNFEVGFRFGRVGRELVERKGLRRFDAVVRIYLANQAPWARHGGTSGQLLRSALAIALKTGDPLAAAASSAHLVWHALVAGAPLVEAEKEAEAAVELHGKLGFGALLDSLAMEGAYIRNLRGLTRQFGSLDDDHFDERSWASRDPGQQHLPVIECKYWVRRLQARFMAGDYVAALDASIRAQHLLWATPTLIVRAEYELYSALARAAACDAQPVDERVTHLQALTAHGQRLDACARECSENFQDRAALVNAEIARIEGRDPDATRLYEEAIRSARANGFIHHEALALELAARFYATRGFDRIAKAYLRDARSCYLQWGADGKVRQLDELHPHLREEDRRPDSTRTLETPVEQLELAVVLEVLQAVSGETDLEKLIATVMRLGMEHAGAERGLLILPRGSGYRVEAEAGIGSDGVTVALRESSVTDEVLPDSAFQYVLRTGESVLLHDAPAESAFSGDPYIRQHRPRSVLCMPLFKQTRMVGILYLENGLTPGVFTPDRMALLKLLASEAAISIENARLYRDLAERKSRIRRMIDASIIGIFSWHADGRVLDANEEFVRIIGHRREDLVSGRVRWTDFTLPEWRERDAREMEVLRAGGPSQPQERELLRKDGTRVPVMTGGTMFEGSTDEGVAFVFDLTERKRVEQALRESEHESRLIVNTIPGLVAALTPAGDVDVVNDQLVEYCGQGLEAMRQWGTNGTVHPEDLPRVAEVFTQGIAAGEAYEVEGRIRRFDGVYRWFQIRGLPLRDTRGQIVRWYSLLSDVDDRKRAEVELRRAYDSFVDAQRLSKTGSFIADIVGDDNVFSEEASRIFEFDPATKITVQRVREVIHPDDLPGWDAMIARAMTGQDVDFAYRIVTTRGAVKHVRGIAHVREQIAGRPLFVGALQDVTESVVKEEALTRARSELAHVSRLTTMGELTASIAHEVKQPIAAAVTSAQTALGWLEAQPPELGEVRVALARIVRAGMRAGDVVGRIRALVTKAPPRKESVEINAAIREVVELTRGEAAKNRVCVRTVLAEGVPLIQGDRVQLQQVILNLIMNGIEAMAGVGEASRDLLISARKGDAEEVLVAVADTGPGLAAGALEQMFAAFHTTKPGGLGLGLSICRSIIEAHDGRLWASANEPRGAVFQFTLPAPSR